MLADDILDRAAEQIADGQPVDWPAAEGSTRTPEDEHRIACLRIVDAVARAHRALPPDPAQGAGTMWGRYRLIQEVGAGSYGSVYRAFDPELEREVAIKILHRHVADSQLRDRLLQEGRALAKVRDTHVVSVLGVESYGDRVGLCMEFVHGDTLEQVLKTHGTMNAREATLVGQDVCRALAAVHGAGYVHRDVKVRNIMRDRTGRIVLMDFGAGREVDEGGGTGRANVAGTPPYMAPEVLAGEPATARSDVYSVGVLLYHLVTGRYPVEGSSIAEIRSAHMLGQRTPISERRSDLPLPFVQLIDRATVANPQDRWPSAGALLEALAAAMSDTPVRASWKALASMAVAALAAATALVTLLGWVMSYFSNNLVLGRAAFVRETPRDWLYWGLVSLASTIALGLFSAIVGSVALVVRRLALGVSSGARRFDAWVMRPIHRLQLDDAAVASHWALLCGAAVAGFAWWWNVPFLEELLGLYPDTLSTAPASKLAFLSSANRAAHENYRLWWVWSTIICGAAWAAVWWLSIRTRQRIGRGVLAAGALVLLFTLIMGAFPYRLLVKSDMEAARLRGQACYVAGERGEDVLVFCPGAPPPRSQVVPTASPDFERLGVVEDILTRISPNVRVSR
jgi:hypothetical protein